MTPERLAAFMATQDSLLEQAATRVREGGRLIYATCSILPCENEGRIDAFLARHAGFTIRSCAEVWRESVGTASPPGMATYFKVSPHRSGMDGFFTAVMERTR